MAINSDCDECGKTFPHSVSDYSRFCSDCEKSNVFTLVVGDRYEDLKANVTFPTTIQFDKSISLREARSKCEEEFGDFFVSINHRQPRYGSGRIG